MLNSGQCTALQCRNQLGCSIFLGMGRAGTGEAVMCKCRGVESYSWVFQSYSLTVLQYSTTLPLHEEDGTFGLGKIDDTGPRLLCSFRGLWQSPNLLCWAAVQFNWVLLVHSEVYIISVQCRAVEPCDCAVAQIFSRIAEDLDFGTQKCTIYHCFNCFGEFFQKKLMVFGPFWLRKTFEQKYWLHKKKMVLESLAVQCSAV